MSHLLRPTAKRLQAAAALALLALGLVGFAIWRAPGPGAGRAHPSAHSHADAGVPCEPANDGGAPIATTDAPPPSAAPGGPGFAPCLPTLNTSGWFRGVGSAVLWEAGLSLEDVRTKWQEHLARTAAEIERGIGPGASGTALLMNLIAKASLLNAQGDPRAGYKVLERARDLLAHDPPLASSLLYTVIFVQGVTAMRCGENDNCLAGACRQESSCIVPFSPAAVHQRPEGSRLAVRHFTEYLLGFPDDLGVRWLLNLAHMTLGEYPQGVDPRFRIPFERFTQSEFDIGRFRDVAATAGVDRFNQAGGAILEDFDGDGLLDLATTEFDPAAPMALYRNRGDGTFEDRTAAAGVSDQLGGLYCVQTDYDNDGRPDIFIARGAWLRSPIRPTLLRNEGAWKFKDVTQAAGLIEAVNSISAQWADFDNDGWLDLFVCCEAQPNRLYRNRGDGTFEDVAERAGVRGVGGTYKGCTWADVDNDRFPELFVTDLMGYATLYRNRRDGTFQNASLPMAIDGPRNGFSCWSWDFDNDGWLDLFATCYDRTLDDLVRGLIGERRRGSNTNRLFRNLGGTGFADMTRTAGLDLVFATMGSNYADFDNDGFLDLYLATGDPNLSTLVPNRCFKNVAGRRFSDITASTGTGHLQKGHAVACGDWDRDGDVDLFVEMGGAVDGDRFRNALFQNPGQGHHSLTVKLVGKRTNRAAIGARIQAVTDGPEPLTVHRHVSSGSSFGANPLEQTIGLGAHTRVLRLEVYWPTSDTRQVFHDLAADQVLRITELDPDGTYEVVGRAVTRTPN